MKTFIEQKRRTDLSRITVNQIRKAFIEDGVKFFLMIAMMHSWDVINRNKMQAMFKHCRTGDFRRKRNLYQCSITKQFHEDVTLKEVIAEVFEEKLTSECSISLTEVLLYAKQFLNIKDHEVIAWVRSNILVSLIFDLYAFNENSLEDISKEIFQELTYEPEVLSYSWCCEDCDGPREDSCHKKARTKEEIDELVRKYLL